MAPARGGRAAGSIALLRALLPRVAALTQARGASTRARERRRARRYHDLRRFFAAFKGGAGMGGGLRPTDFLPAAAPGVPPGPPPTRRPCQSDAERREAADQDWAWMHDRQPAFPPPAFLRRVWDPPPAPAVPRWTVDWQQWGDLSGTGWPRLTLWDRVLARALLPPDAPDLPHLRGLLREAGAPLTTGEREWFLRAPAHKAPDPISQFKIRGLEAFPDRFQALAVSLAEVAITRGIAPPAAKPSATVHAPKADGGTRPLGLWAELLKRTGGLAAQRLTRAATPLPPGLLTQGWNVAYTPGASSSDIMGIIRVLVEADQLLGLGLVWIMGDYHKWFDVVRREFVEAKLDALGVAPSVCRLVADIYYKQLCRQLTAYGPSPGRFRGPAGLTQGSHGSPLWSLLVQDPLWVLLAEELRVPGRGAQVLGVDIPGMGYSDDGLLVLAKDSALRPILAVFGAACEDLGISCKPKALQVFLRRPLAPGEEAPPVAAWDPFQGEPLVARPRARADTDTTPHLGVPRAPAGPPAPLRARAERKLELGAATLAGYRLRWDEMGPSTRAFLGGTANYAPLDAELDAEWLHKLDVRLARLPRQSLHMGMASRLFHYLPPRAGGLDLPCAVIDYGILPRVRELLLELNDPGSWGKLARALWDHTRIPVEGIDWATDPDAVTRAATDASRSHIGRCCAMLG